MRPLRIAVVGAGPMGRLHARAVARRASRSGDCVLCRVIDRHGERSASVAREFGGKAATGWRDAGQALDAAIVAVPTHAHATVALELFDRGLDLLVEKPLAGSAQEARRLVEAAARSDRILQVGQTEWYSPVWREAVRRAGALRRIEVTRLHPRTERGLDMDVVQDFMIHDLDWVARCVGEEVYQVRARGRRILHDGWDEAEAELDFASGVHASLRASRVAPARVRRFRLEGRRAVVTGDLLTGVIEGAGPGNEPDPPALEPARANVEDAVSARVAGSDGGSLDLEPLDRQLDDFLEACRTRRPPQNAGEVGLRAVELVERVQHEIVRAAEPVAAASDGS